jgi:peptidoglycan/xylan/chitin deacetylase (PgdA/CDA1 family)
MPRYALTFDDGPGPCTEEILASLAAAGARATFFILGRNLAEAPWTSPPGDRDRARALVVRALREGHAVGNHTYSHQRPPEACATLPGEIRRVDDLIRDCRAAAGVPPGAPILFRLPYGIRLVERTVPTPTGTINVAALDPRLPIVASLARAHCHWTGDFGDWEYGDADPAAADVDRLAAAMLAHVEQTAAAGLDAVLDLHDSGTGSGRGYIRRSTARAVAHFVDEAVRRGWDSFTL